MAKLRMLQTTAAREPTALTAVLTRPPEPVRRIEGVVIGKFTGTDPAGVPLIDVPLPGFVEPVPARSTVALEAYAVGREVAILFEEGRPERALVVGLIHDASPHGRTRTEVETDGERLVLSAEREIVIRCGKASITLTRAGKVLVRGAYLSSRSSGVNRIKGGSIQLN